jgi:hypothetical protein
MSVAVAVQMKGLGSSLWTLIYSWMAPIIVHVVEDAPADGFVC